MPLAATYTPGRNVNDDDLLTPGLLNQIFRAAVIAISGTLDTAQISAKAVTPSKLEFGAAYLGAGGGTATAHTVTISSDLTDHADGLLIRYRVPADSTGAGSGVITLAITADGGAWASTKDLRKENGKSIQAGDLRSGQEIWVSYDSANGYYQILGDTLAADLVVGDSAGSSNAYTLGDTGSTKEITAYANGVPFLFRANHTNTGAATLNVCGIGAKDLKKSGGTALEAGDIVQDKYHLAVYDSTDDNIELISVLTTFTPVAIVGATRNLHIRSKSGSEDTTLEINADEIILKNGISDSVVAAFTSTSDLVISDGGDLGLDTGSEATSTWYYIWAMYDSSDASTTFKFSASATNPTMGDYTHKALIGAIYNDSSGNLIKINQRDRWVDIALQNVIHDQVVSSADTYESVSLSTIVPDIATAVKGIHGTSNNSAAGSLVTVCAADANGVGEIFSHTYSHSGLKVYNFEQATPFQVTLSTAQTLYWKANTAGANDGVRIDITGYAI